MHILAQHVTSVLIFLLGMSGALAAPEAQLCGELAASYTDMQTSKRAGAARAPTALEQRRIDQAKIELLDNTDYAMGRALIDADNDGVEDLVVWNIQGTGRFVHAALYDIPSGQVTRRKRLAAKAELDLGVLREPQFLRVRGVNYVVWTDTGDDDGISIGRIASSGDGNDAPQTLCRMQTIIRAETTCRHPACKKLKETIENKNDNGPFTNILWPHKYFAPAGLEIYFPEDASEGDFDNSGKPTSLWRFGRAGYDYQHIYWAVLGQGDAVPDIDPALRPQSEDARVRRVLPGAQHERLRQTLALQSATLSNVLHRPIALPTAAEFFLFKANGDRTYWAWDLGSPPDGQEMHITYTKGPKADYIGMLRIIRKNVLAPCASNCDAPAGR